MEKKMVLKLGVYDLEIWMRFLDLNTRFKLYQKLIDLNTI